jgi:uncharacterized membrane protein
MPPDLDLPKIAAIALIFFAWSLYGPILKIIGRGTLNHQLHAVRRSWMNMHMRTARDHRVFDAILMGHIMNSISFFGSATLLVLAGLVGTMVNVAALHAVVTALKFVSPMSEELFAVYLAVLTSALGVSFFSFVYALRKLAYTLAMMGGMGPAPGDDSASQIMEEQTARVLTEAVKSLNNGIRGYYFAVAALFLFVGPYTCMAMTLAMAFVLYYRQAFSPTAKAIATYVDAMKRRDA